MTIQQTIRRQLAETAAGHEIADVRIGLGYTAVMLENGQTGLAATPKAHLQQGCTVFTGMLPLIHRRAADLLALITSIDPLETAVGLATANALANTPSDDRDSGDVLEIEKVNQPVAPSRTATSQKGTQSLVPPHPNMA
jgi:uncharacterized protein (DUF4213/DUF364 family)